MRQMATTVDRTAWQVRILRGAMLVAIGLYAYVLRTVPAQNTAPLDMTLLRAVVGIAGIVAFVAIFLPPS